MTSRAELKQRAKKVLRPNYWKIVLVSLIFALVGGQGAAGAGGNVQSTLTLGENVAESVYTDYNGYDYDEYYDSDFGFGEFEEMMPDLFAESPQNGGRRALPAALLQTVKQLFARVNPFLLAGFVLVIALMGMTLHVLIFSPLSIGCIRFFLVSQHFPAKLGELGYTFDTDYWNGVKTMLLMNIKVFLWTLLFIIPGIIKSYEYMMVPYLLAEHPDMPTKEVFAASRYLMRGNKWRAFVLNLSFILWDILGSLTMGVVNVLYVGPYRSLTNAAFYEAICQEKQ